MDEHRVVTISDSFEEIAGVLVGFLKRNNSIYLHTEPEITDFRQTFTGIITMLGANGEGVQFNLPNGNLQSLVGMLTCSVFGGNKTVYTWDVKKLFSYFYHRLVRRYQANVLARVIDIKYGEAFLGIDSERPQFFEDAQNRGQHIVNHSECWNIHHRVHVPLATRVLPKVETAGLLDVEHRGVRFPVYDIEGQVHGRLRCRKAFPDSLLAHNLQKEDKARLRPARLDCQLAVLDYKAMEVYILHWLSKDERLGKIISSGRDIYSTIYSLLFGLKCADSNRQFIKDTFLPVVYGIQSESLANKLEISQEDAKSLIEKYKTYFATAMSWVQKHQDQAREGVVCDYLGRPRSYEKEHWIARNAIVQGPAAAVCLEKLVSVYDELFGHCEIVATIHDAYILEIPKYIFQEIVLRATQILEEPSQILPDLKLKVGVNVAVTDLANTVPFV